MRTPQRKLGKYSHLLPDQNLSEERYKKLQAEYDKLKNYVRPPAINEVKRLALMGDFSENVAYQMAKGRLRGINKRLDDIDSLLKRANIINPQKNLGIVQLGSTVSLEINDKKKKYKIMGSTETNPSSGIISHNSPLGEELMGKRINDKFIVKINNNTLECKILDIK